jgi:two-component system, LuxR family, response regulator FixJ
LRTLGRLRLLPLIWRNPRHRGQFLQPLQITDTRPDGSCAALADATDSRPVMDQATIFVVDDDSAVRDSLGLLLETSGYRVASYNGGRAFLEALPPHASGCVLVDVLMPDMGGFEVQQELRRRQVPLPVIVITGHGDVPLAVRAMKAGAVDFIEKPYAEDALLAAVERALQLDRASTHERALADAIRELATQLTPREREVLDYLVAGHPNKVIAYRMSISPRTVEIHRARVMEKMKARTLSELVRMSIEADLVVRPEA